jgi:hypothetical protein
MKLIPWLFSAIFLAGCVEPGGPMPPGESVLTKYQDQPKIGIEGWRAYAARVSGRVVSRLRTAKEPLLSKNFSVVVKLWMDAAGMITRVELMVPDDGQSREIFSELKPELVGLKLDEPPPADMPMPIRMRIEGHPR